MPKKGWVASYLILKGKCNNLTSRRSVKVPFLVITNPIILFGLRMIPRWPKDSSNRVVARGQGGFEIWRNPPLSFGRNRISVPLAAGWKPGSSQFVILWKHWIPAGVYPILDTGPEWSEKEPNRFFQTLPLCQLIFTHKWGCWIQELSWILLTYRNHNYYLSLSFLRKQESRYFYRSWIPVFTGMTPKYIMPKPQLPQLSAPSLCPAADLWDTISLPKRGNSSLWQREGRRDFVSGFQTLWPDQ